MSFDSLGLSEPLVKAVQNKGYDKPSPIQQKAIPTIIEGRDVMAAAQTGTGKTAGFTLPLLHRLSDGERAKPNQARALILTPTRELAAQVAASVEDYGQHLALRSTVVFGGVKINPQMMALRKGADILVATPGRLLDLYQQKAVKFSELEVLVLDEADRMLDMGFIHDIRRILKLLPAKRQNLLFSATFSQEIRELAKSFVSNPVEISVSPPNTTANTVRQLMHPVDKKQKSALLRHLTHHHQWQQVLVFSRTKHGANKLVKQLNNDNISSLAIHGNKSQSARTKALAEFKSGGVRVLVATDIAARGLDISELPLVINFDLPNVAEDYVHRIGRTGRAGSKGQSISLVSADEFKELSGIERLIKKLIPREYIDDFYPDHDVPESRLNHRSIKPKKPKKPKSPSQKDGDKRPNNKKASSRHAANKNPHAKKGATNSSDNRRNRNTSAQNTKSTPKH